MFTAQIVFPPILILVYDSRINAISFCLNVFVPTRIRVLFSLILSQAVLPKEILNPTNTVIPNRIGNLGSVSGGFDVVEINASSLPLIRGLCRRTLPSNPGSCEYNGS